MTQEQRESRAEGAESVHRAGERRISSLRVSEPSPPGPPPIESADHPSHMHSPRAHARAKPGAAQEPSGGAPPRTHRRRRPTPATARMGHAQSHGSRRQSTHAASPPTHRYHRNARTSARRAGRARTASSPFVASPCTACATSSGARQRDTWGRTPVAPRRPTDSHHPRPSLRAARDAPCDAQTLGGAPAPRSRRSSAHKDWLCNYALTLTQCMARSGVSTRACLTARRCAASERSGGERATRLQRKRRRGACGVA